MSNLNDAMEKTMAKIKELVDVNTVIGQPITTIDGTTLIPVSKVSFGFVSGGHDQEEAKKAFSAGSGAGVSILPIAFIVVTESNVRMIYIDSPTNTAVDKVIDMVPGIIDKFKKPQSTDTAF